MSVHPVNCHAYERYSDLVMKNPGLGDSSFPLSGFGLVS